MIRGNKVHCLPDHNRISCVTSAPCITLTPKTFRSKPHRDDGREPANCRAQCIGLSDLAIVKALWRFSHEFSTLLRQNPGIGSQVPVQLTTDLMKTENKILIRLGLLTALTCSSGILSAQTTEGPDGPRRPPQEALDACKSVSAVQECSFASPHGTVRGSCWAPEGKPLACRPKDAPSDGSQPMKK